VKLTVFHSADGDCLLLTSHDARHALVDGGRAGTFVANTWPRLRDMAAAGEELDLVVVSHIDADHIAGVNWLLGAAMDWAMFDHQRGPGGNPDVSEPEVDRPPTIHKVWHNAWTAVMGDLAGPVASLATRVTVARNQGLAKGATGPALAVFDAFEDIATSIPHGVQLRQTIADVGIPRNTPFPDNVLLNPTTPHIEQLGETTLTVLGPTRQNLERLREDWRIWILGLETSSGAAARLQSSAEDALTALTLAEDAALVASVFTAARVLHSTDPKQVTPPNRASITLLAEEGSRTCLLTGDANESELLEGLRAAGKINGAPFHCNVLKVQHHGSEHNLSTQFTDMVVADNYVFCADGNNDNPDPSVVKTIVEAHLHASAQVPATLWFNCSVERTKDSRRPALRAAIQEARRIEKRPDCFVRVLDDQAPAFELEV